MAGSDEEYRKRAREESELDRLYTKVSQLKRLRVSTSTANKVCDNRYEPIQNNNNIERPRPVFQPNQFGSMNTNNNGSIFQQQNQFGTNVMNNSSMSSMNCGSDERMDVDMDMDQKNDSLAIVPWQPLQPTILWITSQVGEYDRTLVTGILVESNGDKDRALSKLRNIINFNLVEFYIDIFELMELYPFAPRTEIEKLRTMKPMTHCRHLLKRTKEEDRRWLLARKNEGVPELPLLDMGHPLNHLQNNSMQCN